MGQPTADASLEVLERWVLEEVFGKRRDLIDGTLRQFIDAVAEDMAPLLAALSSRDLKTTEGMAHRMKGAALLVGAARLAAASRVIENAAREGDWQTVDRYMPALTAASDEITQAIEEDLASVA